ncbi:hypothetical protein HDU93_003204 [Gonapodya sp. JEL0774]|nr:hypothetical protein HDU93_003204 [Gonapodya sp. JEL0774]
MEESSGETLSTHDIQRVVFSQFLRYPSPSSSALPETRTLGEPEDWSGGGGSRHLDTRTGTNSLGLPMSLTHTGVSNEMDWRPEENARESETMPDFFSSAFGLPRPPESTPSISVQSWAVNESSNTSLPTRDGESGNLLQNSYPGVSERDVELAPSTGGLRAYELLYQSSTAPPSQAISFNASAGLIGDPYSGQGDYADVEIPSRDLLSTAASQDQMTLDQFFFGLIDESHTVLSSESITAPSPNYPEPVPTYMLRDYYPQEEPHMVMSDEELEGDDEGAEADFNDHFTDTSRTGGLGSSRGTKGKGKHQPQAIFQLVPTMTIHPKLMRGYRPSVARSYFVDQRSEVPPQAPDSTVVLSQFLRHSSPAVADHIPNPPRYGRRLPSGLPWLRADSTRLRRAVHIATLRRLCSDHARLVAGANERRGVHMEWPEVRAQVESWLAGVKYQKGDQFDRWVAERAAEMKVGSLEDIEDGPSSGESDDEENVTDQESESDGGWNEGIDHEGEDTMFESQKPPRILRVPWRRIAKHLSYNHPIKFSKTAGSLRDRTAAECRIRYREWEKINGRKGFPVDGGVDVRDSAAGDDEDSDVEAEARATEKQALWPQKFREKLDDVVRRFGHLGWLKVAEEMGPAFTPFDCFRVHVRGLNPAPSNATPAYCLPPPHLVPLVPKHKRNIKRAKEKEAAVLKIYDKVVDVMSRSRVTEPRPLEVVGGSEWLPLNAATTPPLPQNPITSNLLESGLLEFLRPFALPAARLGVVPNPNTAPRRASNVLPPSTLPLVPLATTASTQPSIPLIPSDSAPIPAVLSSSHSAQNVPRVLSHPPQPNVQPLHGTPGLGIGSSVLPSRTAEDTIPAALPDFVVELAAMEREAEERLSRQAVLNLQPKLPSRRGNINKSEATLAAEKAVRDMLTKGLSDIHNNSAHPVPTTTAAVNKVVEVTVQKAAGKTGVDPTSLLFVPPNHVPPVPPAAPPPPPPSAPVPEHVPTVPDEYIKYLRKRRGDEVEVGTAPHAALPSTQSPLTGTAGPATPGGSGGGRSRGGAASSASTSAKSSRKPSRGARQAGHGRPGRSRAGGSDSAGLSEPSPGPSPSDLHGPEGPPHPGASSSSPIVPRSPQAHPQAHLHPAPPSPLPAVDWEPGSGSGSGSVPEEKAPTDPQPQPPTKRAKTKLSVVVSAAAAAAATDPPASRSRPRTLNKGNPTATPTATPLAASASASTSRTKRGPRAKNATTVEAERAAQRAVMAMVGGEGVGVGVGVTGTATGGGGGGGGSGSVSVSAVSLAPFSGALATVMRGLGGTVPVPAGVPAILAVVPPSTATPTPTPTSTPTPPVRESAFADAGIATASAASSAATATPATTSATTNHTAPARPKPPPRARPKKSLETLAAERAAKAALVETLREAAGTMKVSSGGRGVGGGGGGGGGAWGENVAVTATVAAGTDTDTDHPHA